MNLAFRSFISVDIVVRMSQHMTCEPSHFHFKVIFPNGQKIFLICNKNCVFAVYGM